MAGSASERDSGTHNPPPSRVKEHVVRDTLSRRLGATVEVLSPAGSIDIMSENEIIEVKHCRLWKSGVGQVISYGIHYPSHTKRLHLFTQKGDTRASKYVEMARIVCSACDIRVTFEEVVPTTPATNVAHDTGVGGCSMKGLDNALQESASLRSVLGSGAHGGAGKRVAPHGPSLGENNKKIKLPYTE